METHYKINLVLYKTIAGKRVILEDEELLGKYCINFIFVRLMTVAVLDSL